MRNRHGKCAHGTVPKHKRTCDNQPARGGVRIAQPVHRCQLDVSNRYQSGSYTHKLSCPCPRRLKRPGARVFCMTQPWGPPESTSNNQHECILLPGPAGDNPDRYLPAFQQQTGTQAHPSVNLRGVASASAARPEREGGRIATAK